MQLVTLDEPPDAGGQPLFVDFLNTLHWYEGAPIELIGTQPDFAAWLAEHGLPADDLDGCLPDVHRLREHVRGITRALAAHQPLPEDDIDALQTALSSPTINLQLDDVHAATPHLTLATNAKPIALFSLRVALSVAVFLRAPQRHRLKLCANPGCGFAFLDTSINAARRWCDMRYCGNRLKVRAFRRRQSPANHADERTR
jgi:predicted RNA-binding Zn ribbon-like protein